MDEAKPSYVPRETSSDDERLPHNYNLTRKEEMVVRHLVDELDFEYGELKRNPKGVDFTYKSSLGIEVKKSSSYAISSVQLSSINDHDLTLIIVSKNRGCWVEDAIESVEVAETKEEYTEMFEKATD